MMRFWVETVIGFIEINKLIALNWKIRSKGWTSNHDNDLINEYLLNYIK